MSQAVSRSEERTVRAFIEAKVTDEAILCELRDTLFTVTDAHLEEYRKIKPHLTIIPPFTIPASATAEIDAILEDHELLGGSIPINGISIWPNFKNPRVILLDTPIDLDAVRAELLDVLDDYGAYEVEPCVPPHITLFKTDNGYTVSPEFKHDLQTALIETTPLEETTICYVDLTVVEFHTCVD